MEGVEAGTLTFKNNTVSGTWHSGLRIAAYDCGTKNPKIADNVAHSISGMGVIVLAGGKGCSEFSRFYGYKN